MPRIELITAATAPLTTRQFFEGGDPGPIAAAIAQVPELLGPSLNFLGAVLGPGCLSTRLKELVILRMSVDAHCRYCINAHTCVALDVGLSVDEIRALRGYAPIVGTFSNEAEMALLAWVDAMATTNPIDDQLAASVKQYFADHELVELTLLASTTLLLNRLCTALELPNDDGTLARLASEGFDLAGAPKTLNLTGTKS